MYSCHNDYLTSGPFPIQIEGRPGHSAGSEHAAECCLDFPIRQHAHCHAFINQLSDAYTFDWLLTSLFALTTWLSMVALNPGGPDTPLSGKCQNT